MSTASSNRMPSAETLIENRVREMLESAKRELSEAEDMVRIKKKEVAKLNFILSGSEAGLRDNMRQMQESTSRGGVGVSWTESELHILHDAIKKHKGETAGSIAAAVKLQFPERSLGGITQRVRKEMEAA